ncbi:unnamed protein product, partial [Durusdinium trenchii]
MDVDVVAAAEKLMAPDGEKGFVAVSAEGPAQAALGQVVKTQAALAPTDEQLVKEDLDESIGNSLHPRQLDHEFSTVDEKLLLQDLVEGEDLRREQLKMRSNEKAKAEEEREKKKQEKASKPKSAPKPRGRPRKALEDDGAEGSCPGGASKRQRRAPKKKEEQPEQQTENPDPVDDAVLAECFNAMRRFESAKYDRFSDTLHLHEFQSVKPVPYWDRNDVGLKVPIDASGKYGQREADISPRVSINPPPPPAPPPAIAPAPKPRPQQGQWLQCWLFIPESAGAQQPPRR